MDREIRDAVFAIDVQAREDQWCPPEYERFRQVCERYSYDKVATLLLDLYGNAPGPHQKAQALSAMEVFVRQYPFPVALQQMKEVGVEALFDKDVAVSVSGLRLLKAIEPPDLRDLVRRRLASTNEVDLAVHAIEALDPDEAWEYVRSVLSNSNLKGESFPDWQARSRLILRACSRARWPLQQPPAGLVLVTLDAVVKDPTLAKEAARVLVNLRGDAAPPSVSETLTRISSPAARLRMEAAFIALSEDPLRAAEHAVDRLHDAALRYRGEDECWPELVVRTRCLAFAACASRNLDLLRAIWTACSPLKTRDRGELLEVMAHEFWSAFTEGVTFPALTARDQPLPSELFPVFLGGLPTDELKVMAGLCYPDLGREVRKLLTLRGAANGQEPKDRDEIEKVVARLETVFPPDED
jgi:hypothetical protein